MSVKTFTIPEGTLQISLAKPEMSSQHQETGRVKQPLGHDVAKDFKVASRILHLYCLAMFLEDFMSAGPCPACGKVTVEFPTLK